jgi:hypothetical protein
VAQLASHRGSRASDALTVADLLNRNAPVPDSILEAERSPPVSVDSLLRREGRSADEPEVTDPAVTDPAVTDLAAAPSGEQAVRRILVRTAVITAGTLLTVGSAFGAAVLAETFLLAPPAPAAVPDVAQTVPDDSATAPSTLIDRAAAGEGPDAGTPGPTSWTQVAFPTAAVENRAPVTKAAAPARAATAAPTAKRESRSAAPKASAAPTSAASKPAATQPAARDSSSSGSTPTTKNNGGLLGTAVDTTKGILGL